MEFRNSDGAIRLLILCRMNGSGGTLQHQVLALTFNTAVADINSMDQQLESLSSGINLRSWIREG
jgi:hypothetical protein